MNGVPVLAQSRGKSLLQLKIKRTEHAKMAEQTESKFGERKANNRQNEPNLNSENATER
jgi:hypothetical protein